MLTHFIIHYLKSTFINIITNLIRKVFKYWEAIESVDVGFP